MQNKVRFENSCLNKDVKFKLVTIFSSNWNHQKQKKFLKPELDYWIFDIRDKNKTNVRIFDIEYC